MMYLCKIQVKFDIGNHIGNHPQNFGQVVALFIPRHTIVAGYYVSCWLSVCPSVPPSVVCPSIFLFLDANLSKYQWIFTKLRVCIDIVEIWFEILMGKFCQFLTVIY